MKKMYLFCFSFMCIISCDRASLEPEGFYSGDGDRTGVVPPYHPQGDFDQAGIVYGDLLQSYFALENTPKTLDSVVMVLHEQMRLHPYFDTLESFDADKLSLTLLQSIIDTPSLSLASALSEVQLSIAARTAFEDFLSALFLDIASATDEATVYATIVAYETSVFSDPLLTEAHKTFILTTTSIARHSYHHKKKKPTKVLDLDWDWLTTTMVGAVTGATMSVPDAIAVALKAGLGTP